MAPLRASDRYAAVILVVTLAAALALAFLAAGRVAAPLRELGAAVAAMEPGAAGGGGWKSGSEGGRAALRLAAREDEIGRLAASFVALNGRLEEGFASLVASLKEKEVLLKEVHHRVKNNLQIVSSMLRLQEGSTEAAAARESLLRVQERIQAMAYAHEDLYRSGDFSAVRMGPYLERICDSLALAGESGRGIELRSRAGELELSMDKALPCGLIVNELVTNSVRHAFHGKTGGTVEVLLEREGDEMVLRVEDDGVGLPEGVERREGMGSQLVAALAAQLHGALSLRATGGGTVAELRFPL